MRSDIQIIKTHTPRLIGEKHFFKASVCIALLESKGNYDILFEVRSNQIPDQPGDVCLPGGAVENGESYRDAAIRETCEELLIRKEQIEIIGASDILHNRNTIIYPYVGILKDYQGTYSAAEVAEVFQVPLDYFMETEPERHIIDARIEPREDFPFELIAGGRNYKWRSAKTEELFYRFDGHVIWGLTARMVYAFCDILKS